MGRVKRAGGGRTLVVTGGWSPAFDAVGGRVASVGSGRHQIVLAPDHFPNLTPAFNPVLTAFMAAANARQG